MKKYRYKIETKFLGLVFLFKTMKRARDWRNEYASNMRIYDLRKLPITKFKGKEPDKTYKFVR